MPAGFWRPVIWAVCSATSVFTTKKLMINYGFHYPLTLAFTYFVLLFMAYLLAFVLRPNSWVINNSRNNRLHQKLAGFFVPNTHWIKMLPASLAASISLPMLLEGMLHMPSLAALVMISPLIYATEYLCLFVFSPSSKTVGNIPWDILIVIISCGFVLYNENRLMVPGLIWGVAGLLSLGIARSFFALGLGKPAPYISTKEAYHGFVIMSLIFGTMISGFMAFLLENGVFGWHLSLVKIAVLSLNTAAILCTAITGTSRVVYLAPSFGDRTYVSDRALELLTSLGSNFLLLLVSIFSNQVPYISLTQIAAYFISNIVLLGFDQIHGFDHNQRRDDSGDNGNDRSITNETQEYLQYTRSLIFAAMVAGVSLLLTLASSASINSLPQGPATTYDFSYHPGSRFDIVVSMYKEELGSVKNMLEKIKSTSFLEFLGTSGHNPRVFIYTKDPEADLEALKQATGADIVEQLENVGREGGTYLSHIINKWDALAEQTLFVQAHAHNMRELIPRINDYLVNNTGMLSLGFAGVTCHCGSCADRWGWEDQFRVLPSLYEMVYQEPCNPSQSVLLSYKGQFIASARRIRGIKKEVYIKLLKVLTGEETWNHDLNTIGGGIMGGVTGEDTLSNPFFGFTVERIWGLLMQCATNERIATRCPSLLSGKGRGGLAQDCQCLDEVS